jgi:hypothetical protein
MERAFPRPRDEAVVSGAGGAKGLWSGLALAFKEAAGANRARKEMESASKYSLAYHGLASEARSMGLAAERLLKNPEALHESAHVLVL